MKGTEILNTHFNEIENYSNFYQLSACDLMSIHGANTMMMIMIAKLFCMCVKRKLNYLTGVIIIVVGVVIF